MILERVDTEETTPPNDSSSPAAVARPRARRGFAAMSPERQRELASQGGRAAQRAGTAHRFTREEARIAGRKGGLAAQHRNDKANAQRTAEADSRNA